MTYVALEDYVEVLNMSAFVYNSERFAVFNTTERDYLVLNKQDGTVLMMREYLTDADSCYGFPYTVDGDSLTSQEKYIIYSESSAIFLDDEGLRDISVPDDKIILSISPYDDQTYIIRFNEIDYERYDVGATTQLRDYHTDQIILEIEGYLHYAIGNLFYIDNGVYTTYYVFDGESMNSIHTIPSSISGHQAQTQGDLLMLTVFLPDTNINKNLFFHFDESGISSYITEMTSIEAFFQKDILIMQQQSEYRIYNSNLVLINTLSLEDNELEVTFPLDGTYYVKITSTDISIIDYSNNVFLTNTYDGIVDLIYVRVLDDGSFLIRLLQNDYIFDNETLVSAERTNTIPDIQRIFASQCGDLVCFKTYEDGVLVDVDFVEATTFINENEISDSDVHVRTYDGASIVILDILPLEDPNLYIYSGEKLIFEGYYLTYPTFEYSMLVLTMDGDILYINTDNLVKN